MLITADWVLPVSRPPIRDGAVLVDGDSVVAVATAAELAAHPLADERHDFEGCTITPGLVNAHTHLTLSALAGVVPPLPFAEWLPRLVAAMRPWDIADHEASGVVGAEQCLLAGVTAVGDIAYGAAEVASASAAGLGGVYYWELLGLAPDAVDSQLDYLRYPVTPGAYGPRVICGLSPHAPYSSGPGLLRAVHDRAEALGVPVAVHVAESAAETELMRDGGGPLAPVAARNAPDFTPPGTSTVRYLASIDALRGVTAVHVCHLAEGDVELLAAQARGVVTCPRSNRYLHNPPPLVAELLRAGVAVGVGTDSSASNTDLDLMEEVRAVRTAEPSIDSATLLQMATSLGAKAIGISRRYGSLEYGKAADLAVFDIGHGADPVEAAVRRAGRETLRALMSGGQWRVLEGRLLTSDASAEARAADAYRRAVDTQAV